MKEKKRTERFICVKKCIEASIQCEVPQDHTMVCQREYFHCIEECNQKGASPQTKTPR